MYDVTIDFTEAENALSYAFQEMSKLSNLPIDRIVRAEAGSVLKYCAGATREKQPEQVTPRARAEAIRHLELNRGDVTINSGFREPEKAGRIWARSSGTRSTRRFRMAYGDGLPVGTPTNIHWRRGDWTDIQEAKADYERIAERYMSNAIRSIGLARQSWIQVADSLGIKLEEVPGGHISPSAIARARLATSRYGKEEQNGSSRTSQDPNNFFVEIVNSIPYAARAGMGATLLRAMSGRARYFEESLNHGVFQSLQEISRRYPGFDISAGSN
jgi:hypothetical protein